MKPNELMQLIRCRLDPWYFFINYVRTVDREFGEREFPDFNYLRDLIRRFMEDERIVILKSRQMMVTWTAVAFALWELLFKGNAEILFISKREDDAREAVRRMRYIFERLPAFMKPGAGENTKYVLEFPHRNARFMALPTHPHIGRTYSPTRIIWDEMASTPYDDEIFAAIQPGLDGGGCFIGISTSQGPLTKHAELYTHAEKMGFSRVALHYSMHPRKDDEWRRRAQRGMSDRQWEIEQEMSMTLGGNRIYPAFQRQTHVIPGYALHPPEGTIYRTIDFGYHTPVVLWAEYYQGAVCIFREWIGEDETVSEMAAAIVDGDTGIGISEESVAHTFCDPAGAAKTDIGISSIDLLRAEYFRLTGADIKISHRTSSVTAGVDLVREKLCNAAGEIRLTVAADCTRTIADFGRYVKKRGSEEPKKDGVAEHTMDAVRYLIVNLFQKRRQSGAGLLAPRIAGTVR